MDGEQDSLIDRAVRRLSPQREASARPVVTRNGSAIAWRSAAALAAVIALGPLATIVGAGVLERAAQADAARLNRQALPRTTAAARDRAARGLLRDTVRDAPVAIWLDRVARTLPSDARVSRMTRSGDGTVELDVTAPDPDIVRNFMRRDPVLTGFRETAQRRAGAMILVTYRRAG